jgi:hypothetical protein
MDARSFLAQAYNVHGSRHGDDFIYIGHDPSNQWSALLNGEERDLGFVDTLEQAQAAARRLYDAEQTCALKLEWKLIAETEIRDLVE